jgi:hypothetical protein
VVQELQYEYCNDFGGQHFGETAPAFTLATDDTGDNLQPRVSVNLFSRITHNPCYEKDTRGTHNYTLATDDADANLELSVQSSTASTVEPPQKALQSEDEGDIIIAGFGEE